MRILSIVVLSLLGMATVHANPDAEAVIKTQTELLLNRLQIEETIHNDDDSLESLVVETIGQHVDFSLFSQLVLGKYRKRLTPEEMARFERGLTGVVIKTYAASLADLGEIRGQSDSQAGLQIVREGRPVDGLRCCHRGRQYDDELSDSVV